VGTEFPLHVLILRTLITSVMDALGKVTTYQYDPGSGFLASIIYPKNSESGSNPAYAYAHDSLGRIQSITDPLGHTTSYTYDNLGRIRTVTLPRPDPGFPDNFVLTYSYDNYEEVGGKKLVYTSQEDPNGRATRYYYDEFDQLARVVDAAGKVSQFMYNKGKLMQVQDANLNTTSYEYDKLSRLTTVHHPAGPTSSYTYYGDGLLKTKTDGKGQTITYVYDKLKRLKEKQYPDGKKIVYAYSGEMMGNIQDQVANETTTFAYDQSYRLNSISSPRGTISYTYTAADQVQSYQVNSDPPVALSYYNDGSVKNITRSGESPLAYYYLLTGQKAQVLYPNNARVDYSYDDQGRLTSIINRKPDMSVLSSYTYGYDYNYTTSSYTMKGYRTSMTNNLAQMEKYYFDNLYQLIRVDYPNGDVHQWSYDDIGNRVQQVVIPSGQPPVVTNYTYYQNGQGRNSQLLQSDGANTYTWDNNGNLLTKAATNYTWDYDDRLVGISGPSTSASYACDYQGNRIKKTVSGVETAYLYLSEDIVKEATAGISTNYLHGIGIDEPVMMDRAGAKSYYFSDGLGSIREMTDAMGTVQNSYTYGAWGELRAQNVTVPNSYVVAVRTSICDS
jgi:YD repeat-containing protein